MKFLPLFFIIGITAIFGDVIQDASPRDSVAVNVFKLKSKYGKNGTGFLLKHDDEVVLVTNMHVLDRLTPSSDGADGKLKSFSLDTDLLVKNQKGFKLSVSGLDRVWADRDLAVLTVKHTEVPDVQPLSLERFIPKLIKNVYGVGFPEDQFRTIKMIPETSIVEDKDSFSFASNIDALIGSSGSPLFDLGTGKVVGVVFEVVDNQVTAVYSDYLQYFLENRSLGTICDNQSVRTCLETEKKEASDRVNHFASIGNFLGHYGLKDKKFSLFLESANNGHSGAQFQVGLWYMKKRDKRQALNWMRRSANNGHIAALYYTGFLEDKASLVDGIQKIQQSAENGYSRAKNWLDKNQKKVDNQCQKQFTVPNK